MRRSLPAALVLAAALLGCGAPKGTHVERAEGASLAGLRRLGVLPFADPRGKGREIAKAITGGLAPLLYEPADGALVEKTLNAHKSDNESGLGLESLELLRHEAGADAIVMGRMLPDWSAATISIYETELGDPVLRGLLKPSGRHKTFETPAEVAAEVLKVLADRR